MPRPTPTTVAHFTHIDHLATIAEYGLLSDARARSAGYLTTEAGEPRIKQQRRRRRVTVGPGGVVADYVSFYYSPRSPMRIFKSRSAHVVTATTGNLLEADADALVNTVNTVGVMGKGIALQFRRAYPDMFAAYARACRDGSVSLGHLHVWETGALSGPRLIINFPTKEHWRSSSRLDSIEEGLSDLARVIREYGITSIAVPPLGCGNGGLDWEDVQPVINRALGRLPGVDVRLYTPAGPLPASAMRTATRRPDMTVGRAALVTLVDRYGRAALGATPIEVQKLMYFLQVLGEPLRLCYSENRYGPYADNLRHVLNRVEGHFLTGYGDGTARALDAEPLQTLPGAVDEAATALADHPDTRARIEMVLDTIDGFESMYSIELLATVHWVMASDAGAAADWRVAAASVHAWSTRKCRIFADDHIKVAWEHLQDHQNLNGAVDVA